MAQHTIRIPNHLPTTWVLVKEKPTPEEQTAIIERFMENRKSVVFIGMQKEIYL